MTPYISDKSKIIIFIISINILSVLCELYQPIAKISTPINKTMFKYLNYLENSKLLEADFKLLDVDQYYDSYFNEEYWIIPISFTSDDYNTWEKKQELYFIPISYTSDDYNTWKKKLELYCKEEYISRSQFKIISYISMFGGTMENFKDCLKKNIFFEHLYYCFHISLEESIVNCLGTIADEIFGEIISCHKIFQEEVLSYLHTEEEDLKLTETLKFSKSNVEKRAINAFKIATCQKNSIKITDEYFEILKSNFHEFTDHPNFIYNNAIDFNHECLGIFEKYTMKEYNQLTSIFNGINKNFQTFTQQIQISLKYLETLGGKLGNNTELFQKLRNNPLSENDYHNLLKPLPMIHEKFYPLYLFRISLLNYIPLDESTWNIHMTELSNRTYNSVSD